MWSYDPSFRYDLKYKAANDFENANPKVFAKLCIDPDIMEKFVANENAIDREKAEFINAAHKSRKHRIASESLSIFEDRMIINQSPGPPSWADNGRGGAFDPRTIFEQARNTIDLRDKGYVNQIEQYREDYREELAQQAVANQNEQNISEERSPLDQLKHDVLGLVTKSHHQRTELNKWFNDYRNDVAAQFEAKGSENPKQDARDEQRERVELIPDRTCQKIIEHFDVFEQFQPQQQDQSVLYKMKFEVLGYVMESHHQRTELNKFYAEHKDVIIEQHVAHGSENPVRDAHAEQQKQIAALPEKAHAKVAERFNVYEQSQQLPEQTAQHSQAHSFETKTIPEPPSMDSDYEPMQEHSNEDNTPDLGQDFSNGHDFGR